MDAGSSTPARGTSAGPPPSIRKVILNHAGIGAVIAAILIGVSGRPGWLRAWLYTAVFTAVLVWIGVRLQRLNPDLLAERSRMHPETKAWDKVLAPAVGAIGPPVMWAAAALDVRMHWPPAVPVWGSAIALSVGLAGALLVCWALLSNPFFTSTVRIQRERGHTVVDRGPYAFVRHPGYTGSLLVTLASPIALGSRLALIPAGIIAVLLLIRTVLEDRTLRMELEGYNEYARRVPFRLIPGLW